MKKRYNYGIDYEIFEEEVKGRFRTKLRKNLVYKGIYYKFDEDEKQKKNRKLIYLAYAIFLTICFFCLGSQNNDASRKIYVLFPLVSLFLPIYYLWLGTIRQLGLREHMTKVDVEYSVGRIRKSLTGILVLSIGGTLGQIVCLMQSWKSDYQSRDYIFLALFLGVIIVTQLVIQYNKKQKIVEIKELEKCNIKTRNN